jgi:hypothetical protein
MKAGLEGLFEIPPEESVAELAPDVEHAAQAQGKYSACVRRYLGQSERAPTSLASSSGPTATACSSARQHDTLRKMKFHVGIVTTYGNISADAVRNAVLERESTLRCCVRPDLQAGSFIIELVVDALGQPFTARTVRDSLHNKDTLGCMRDELFKMTWPKDRPVRFSVPILFYWP